MITPLRVFIFFAMLSPMASAEMPIPLIDNESAVILDRVKNFYSWVLSNDRSVTALEPRIKNVKGSSKFYLDVTTLAAFSDALMKSGDFSADFPSRVEKYYLIHKKKISQYSKHDFDQMKKNGRGPLMGTEDMDIFFCAQEYEYAQNFIDGMQLADLQITGKSATATVVSPYDWKSEFQFKKVGTRWLISAYCEYK
jgi:hypothetical protein